MKIRKRVLTVTVIYDDYNEREKHIKNMKERGYSIKSICSSTVIFEKSIMRQEDKQ